MSEKISFTQHDVDQLERVCDVLSAAGDDDDPVLDELYEFVGGLQERIAALLPREE